MSEHDAEARLDQAKSHSERVALAIIRATPKRLAAGRRDTEI
jgi:hypothetical protein